MRLDYYPLATPGVVEFSDEDVRPSIAQWEHSLVGAVMEVWVSYYVMEQFVAARWSEFTKPKIFRANNGVFVFRFQKREEVEAILADGPQMFSGKLPLILRLWEPGVKLDSSSLNKVNVWVTLPD